MGRQTGTYHITGCYDNLCFYKMDGKYYVRMKSSLTGKRVKKDPRFKRTMQYAERLVNASKIASALYKALPKEKKGIAVYRMLTGKAMKLLQEGKKGDEILHILNSPVKTKPKKIANEKKDNTSFYSYAFADALIEKVFAERTTEENIMVLNIRKLRRKVVKYLCCCLRRMKRQKEAYILR